MDLSSGVNAILFSRANFLSKKIPPAPESTRAFISNHLSTFFPSSVTSRETENDFSLALASSTGDKEIAWGVVTDIDAGHCSKNPSLQCCLPTSLFHLWEGFGRWL